MNYHENKNSIYKVLIIALLVSVEAPALATYEFPTAWSARPASLAGAVSSSIEGASSLYFNPAGLASIQNKELSVNISPYLAMGGIPYNIPAGNTMNKTVLEPNGAIFGGWKVSDKLGVAIGIYGAGGSGGEYGTVNYSSLGATVNPVISARLMDMETSLGAGYQITDELSVGAAWRISLASSSIKTGIPVPGSPAALSVDGLSATNFSGFRFGAQYRAKNNKWGVGTTLRTSVPLNFRNGSVTYTDLIANTATTGSNAETSTTFPMNLTFGAHYSINPDWLVMFQYDFAQYNVLTTSTLNFAMGGAQQTVTGDMNWSNQSLFRFGTEMTRILPLPIRLGYVYTPQIIPAKTASPTTIAPANYHVISAGSGARLNDQLGLDLAMSYTFGSGQGAGTPGGLYDGNYSSRFLTLHSSLSYSF